MIDLLVKNATLPDGRRVDIACAGGKIAEDIFRKYRG